MSMIGSVQTEKGIDAWVSVQPHHNGHIAMLTAHTAHSTMQIMVMLTSDEARSLGTHLLDAAQQIDLG